ncbi:Utp8p NDAI_0G00960 [Naumovozyma dairenensis CBS 421]|uniref:U3 small nucleolar RNA-associated protein 8 n=1 Tax=Naumovozyma dairenensis (strain ATCC 10597 / BCRC 20456 / CBS 421 / NBRC 0211 / NRRL Y-12639) TaxID=1071378 RepID=G0WDL1_NAUDC|nr:hypothetical protein NDAI_0G00960 [Naumovozyma dairenensis CBS 421]CCD25872.2 hypothetical protein NDAI_0G00960 [Naumovozyma dairenensis CBS 421]
MPSLSQPFRLTVLPKIASLSNYSLQGDYIQVTKSTFNPTTNKVVIGVSGSAISQYIINPTPKLIFNYPIPSTNIVTACDVLENDNDNTNNEVWCFGLVANKTYTLTLITKDKQKSSATMEDDEDVVDVIDTTIKDEFNVKLDSKIVDIKIIKKKADDISIMIVLENGLIQFFNSSLKLLNTVKINYKNVKFVEHFKEDNKDFMFTICDLGDNNKVCIKLFQINNDSAIELNSIIMENFNGQNAKFCYQFGKFYKLTNNNLMVYSLPQFQLEHTTTIPMIKTDDQIVSMKPISTNRILLTINNKIYLLDLIHNSILSERELTHLKSLQLLRSAVIGKGENNNKTITIGVSTKFGVNPTSSLEIINVDVGSNTLKDSLGKCFQNLNLQNQIQISTQALKPLFDPNTDGDKDDDLFKKLVTKEQFNYDEILTKLSENTNDIGKFDEIFFQSFNIKKEHYTENDRFIYNHEFFLKLIDLIFEKFGSTATTAQTNEYPKTLTFLLTHPLFPMERTQSLLSRFANHPRLFKQAIVTCPNLPLPELLNELLTIKNNELSLDISLRILQDYSKDSIKQELRNLPRLEIENFIDFILNDEIKDDQNSPQLFQLLALVLDSIGLFALSDNILENLSAYIDRQVSIVEKNTELWYLIDSNNNIFSHNKKDNSFSSASASTNSKSNNISSNNKKSFTQKEALPMYSVDYLEL